MSKCAQLTLHTWAFLRYILIKLDYMSVIKIGVCSVNNGFKDRAHICTVKTVTEERILCLYSV